MNLARIRKLTRAALVDPTFRVRTGFTLGVCTVVGLLAVGDHLRTLDEIEQLLLSEQRAIVSAKADEVRRFMDTFYENLRAVSLIPAVRGITHRGNRPSADTSAVEQGWFSADASETIQQFYNTLAITVPVSEVYLTLRGYSPHRGEVPFLMYDELVLGGAALAGAPQAQDFPEEAEEAEYDVIEHQIDAFARWYPRFDFPSLRAIPAAMSTSLRTCDNTQYYSRSKHDVHDTFGHVYSVPVYGPGQGELVGVLSDQLRPSLTKVRTGSPSGAQRRTRPSLPADTKRSPPLLNARPRHSPSCARTTRRERRSCASHSRSVPSCPQVATLRPSGLKTTALTSPL